MNELTHDQVREYLSYDKKAGVFRWLPRRDRSKQWNTRYAGKQAGAVCAPWGYRILSIDNGRYRAGRLAIFWVTGKWPDGIVDHINGDRADDRWCNLRVTDKSGNAKNSKRPTDNTSGVIGVSFDARRGKWRSYITDRGKTKTLGRFRQFRDAVAARRGAERKMGFSDTHGR